MCLGALSRVVLRVLRLGVLRRVAFFPGVLVPAIVLGDESGALFVGQPVPGPTAVAHGGG